MSQIDEPTAELGKKKNPKLKIIFYAFEHSFIMKQHFNNY